ncbi:MAG TPA: NACHT domain-containing protein [Trebonia sp.]
MLIVQGLVRHQSASLFQDLLGSASAAIGLLSLGIREVIPRSEQQTDLKEYAKKLNKSRLSLIREEISAALFNLRNPPINIKLTLLKGSSAEPPKRLMTFMAVKDLFMSTPYGRVAVIGSPGAGKSLLALQFALQVSSAQDDDIAHVPIIIPAQTWDPRVPSLDYWLIRQAASLLDIDKSLAWSLLSEDIILPVIDGLDEVDGIPDEPSNAADLIKALNEWNRKFLITCRTDTWEFLEAVGCALEDACKVQLEPLTARQVTEYLEARERPGGQQATPAHMIRELSKTLGSTLSTPFDLALIGSLLGRRESIDRLMRRVKGSMAPGEIETELLAAFVEARVRWYPKRVKADPRKVLQYRSEASRFYSVADVLNWSRSLASFLQDTGGKDIFGRRMPTTAISIERLWPVAGMRAPRIADHLLTILFWAPFLAFCGVLMELRGTSLEVALLIMGSLCIPPASSMWANRVWVHPSKIVLQRLLQPRRLFRLAVGISMAIVITEMGSLGILVAFAAYYGAGFALVFGLGIATAVRDSISLPALAGVGLLIGLLGMGLTRVAIVPTGDPALSFASGMIGGSVSLVVGVKAGIRVAGWRGGGGLDMIPAGLPTPLARLQGDFQAGLTVAFLSVVVGAVIGFASRWPVSSPWEILVLCGLAGVAAGPGYAAATWRRHIAMLICTRRKLPLRLTKFLKWAHSAGLLRTAGRSYEFRHRRLQDWLAP